MNRGVSIAKPNDCVANEDAFYSSENCIAVSDGAGGCGLYADEWSKYLIENLPKEKPITSFEELDEWVDGMWEAFYNAHEEMAREDDTLLSKFYKEGSCATIACAWMTEKDKCSWMAYGDSVVFHYSYKKGCLEHSFTRLADFSNPPRLVSCKDPLEEEGFKYGEFNLDSTSIVFVASDALSHYVLMMYELSKCGEYGEELAEEYLKPSGNSQLLKMAETMQFHFEKDVLRPLLNSTSSEKQFRNHLLNLYDQGILDMDDYTLVHISKL